MSAIYYDEALLKKIQNWTKDTNMKITGVDETSRLFEYRIDQSNDKPIELPLISLSRKPTMRILSTNKKPLMFDGWRKNSTSTKIDQLNAIPIQLEYQIDIYTRHFQEAEDYVRSFVFNIINYPNVKIEIPYNNSNITHISHIKLNEDIEDNSSVSERLIPGQFTRKTISIYIEDAYLFDYKVKDTIQIDLDTNIEVEFESDIND